MAHLSLYYTRDVRQLCSETQNERTWATCRGIGMSLDNAFDCENSVGNDIAEICEFCAIVVESVVYVS
jgi:hypothetical protein